MNLYIWENPVKLGYGNTIVFAMAENIEDARKAAMLQVQNDDVHSMMWAAHHLKLGKPTHIRKAPCAGCWSYEE